MTNVYCLIDEEELTAMMNFPSRFHRACAGRSQQTLVRGTSPFCGATGNRSLWIVVRQAAQLRLALGTEGQVLIVRNSTTRGFHDIAIGRHDSAYIE